MVMVIIMKFVVYMVMVMVIGTDGIVDNGTI